MNNTFSDNNSMTIEHASPSISQQNQITNFDQPSLQLTDQ